MNHSVKRILTACVLAALTAMSSTSLLANITATVSVSQSKVQIAEPFDVTLIVTAPPESRIYFPKVGKTLGDFEVINHADMFDIPSDDQPDVRTWKRRIRLESLKTGDLTLPSFELQTNQKKAIRTKPQPIQVVSVLENRADPMKIRDIKREVDLDVPASNSGARWAWVIGGICGLATLAFAGAKVANRKPTVSAKEWAMNELGMIRRSESLHSADAIHVFARLEGTVRKYFETQFEFSATKQSSAELLAAIDSLTTPEQEQTKATNRRLANLLRQSELAKYAGREFRADELNAAIDDSVQLIRDFALVEWPAITNEEAT